MSKHVHTKKNSTQKNCAFCSEHFLAFNYRLERSKFCSTKCKLSDMHKIVSIKKTGTKHSPESKKKMSETRLKSPYRGNLHPRYAEDRYSISDRTARKFWAKQVFARDKQKCLIANGTCSGRLEAHHILAWGLYPELRFNINNGITLCHAHHPRGRAEEKRMAPVFTGLLTASNSIA